MHSFPLFFVLFLVLLSFLAGSIACAGMAHGDDVKDFSGGLRREEYPNEVKTIENGIIEHLSRSCIVCGAAYDIDHPYVIF